MGPLPCVSHVSHSNGKSFFDDFGLSPEMVQRAELWVEKRDRLTKIKLQLIDALHSWVVSNHSEAEEVLGISRSTLSDLVNKRVSTFSLDDLMEYVLRTETNIELSLSV